MVPSPTRGMSHGDQVAAPFRVTVRHPSTGQADTHVMQPVHSGVHTAGFSCTRISTGHPRVHALQSMQTSRSRTTRCGDAKLASPRSAPYGHRYRHQKFLTTTDRMTRTARVTAVVTLISVKKRSILASAAWLYVPRWNFMIAIASIIHATAHRKKARRKYFREASAW